jgi:hypothetical protein
MNWQRVDDRHAILTDELLRLPVLIRTTSIQWKRQGRSLCASSVYWRPIAKSC